MRFSYHFVWGACSVASVLNGPIYLLQVVVFGGHIDSWDVGTGAMDDMAEVIMSWQVEQAPYQTLKL